MQLSDIKLIYHKELSELYPKEEIDSFFFRSIEFYLKLERFILVMQPNYTLTKSEERPLFETLTRLVKEEPLQYIFKEATFMDLSLEVNEHTLIPRPETEELVQWIIDDCSKKFNQNIRVLDIGTGSGCIAIALATNLKKLNVHAIDISKKALSIAIKNSDRNKVNISFEKADILDRNLSMNMQFDIIVSNPPYVRESEKDDMHNNVKNHEPNSALFVPDNDSLLFYKAIANFSRKHLKNGGKIYLEINQYLGKETQLIFEQENFENISLKKDIFGNERMLKCSKKL